MPPAAKKVETPVAAPSAKPTATATAAPTPTKGGPVKKPTEVTQVASGGAAKKTGAAAKTVSTPTPTPTVPVSTPTDASVVDQNGGASVVGDNLISSLLEKFTSLSTQIKHMQSSLKLLAKEFDKQKKIIDKVQKKKEKAKKSPSGFAKPCKISDELCEFIGIPKGTEQSRTDITRFINSYVKEHNLNNPQNRREFFPDKKLKAILNVKDGEKVTYFVLQRLIAHHFPPSMSKLAAAAKA